MNIITVTLDGQKLNLKPMPNPTSKNCIGCVFDPHYLCTLEDFKISCGRGIFIEADEITKERIMMLRTIKRLKA